MEHRVIAYSGCCYANEPREFFIGDDHHQVRRVIRTWVEETQGLEGLRKHVWRVLDQDGCEFKLTYHYVSDFWEIAPV